MKLSVIVVVKEIDEYLINCIDSIVNQNCDDFEVIVVDEEATDNSGKLLSKYENINIISVYNYSSFTTEGSSLNYGLSKAKGEYVMFVDSIDYLEDDFLKEIYEYLGDSDLFKYDFSLLNGKIEKEVTHNITSSLGYKALEELSSVNDNFNKLNKYLIKRKLLTDNKIALNQSDFYSNLTIMPYLLMLSKKFNNSELTGYVYRKENNNYRRGFLNTPRKLAYDVLSKYEYLESLNFTSTYSEEEKGILLNYISKKVLNELKNLKGKEKKEFKRIIKNKKIKDNIKKESFFKKIFRRK